MKHILHHFRRNRTYSSHERWGVFAVLGALTILVSASSFILFGEPVASASSLAVFEINPINQTLSADGLAHGQTTITVIDKKTSQAVVGVWVGLQVTNPTLRSMESTYLDWYSPEPGRAFYQTDERGQVSFLMISSVPGEIEYAIFAANPELKNDNKYQDLEQRFKVVFE
ncbi:hypothetical protein A3K24_01385 [candidate division Kazan bacterium RIFCSPHIGHO2_01_FULL_44_14]|uniref:Uncharacterized protein n=1 Tax=candidate division Kazan bacterium RIFCSPLOWO2_01_FULL_45_19 TaxID=1798538 RepID=A0A1F4NPW6_UNCK3|nr:hypothetical protein [uncultured bacterium]OGB73494.1 MAG: hypothetical protein A3K51_01385 [candidate division Kazan bacterium RIFCSPLOWO2_01_FULL_45_19]OGB77739.1 MAG: hypothetical protein A3K24_01385 [candidate division Kazan bacterium RIFCSPHIGHO2_01_FULL_44_14]